MKIAVYSGSFNPLHIGHKAIIGHLCGMFDRVYLVVSPKNPLKEGISVDSGQERYMAAVEAVRRSGFENVVVDDIELHMPAPQYTFRTLDALKQREPSNTFTLVMGGDQIADIRRWREYRHILKDYGVVVFPRHGFDLQEIKRDLLAEDPDYVIEIADVPEVDVSSTQIRRGLAEGRDVSDLMM